MRTSPNAVPTINTVMSLSSLALSSLNVFTFLQEGHYLGFSCKNVLGKKNVSGQKFAETNIFLDQIFVGTKNCGGQKIWGPRSQTRVNAL